ncbi:hypothetical protein I5E68_11420 [Novosphingobium sp. YJ-S2-02]|uniref:Uncharacterized protein n=1 Tax=Novosphingobium aureum TaxID=2792964 RepID=A0A931MLK5_9SPHN|nr:hypothetical protein [Novosphingobium aureum]MBH0113559.1 hypothetical protein [Novosphingobium aureum]
MKMLVRLAVLAALAALAWYYAAPAIAEWHLRSAFEEAGMGEGVSACIAGRMARELSVPQLIALRSLEGEKHSLRDLREAASGIEDPVTIRVTTRAAVLCSTGLAR